MEKGRQNLKGEGKFSNVNFLCGKGEEVRERERFGSGTFYGEMLLVRIIENNIIDAYFM